MRTISLEYHLLVIALVLVACSLDSPFDIFFRHILASRGLKQCPKARVAGYVRTTLLYGDGDFFSYLGEDTGHMTPSFELSFFSEFKCTSHSVLYLMYMQ